MGTLSRLRQTPGRHSLTLTGRIGTTRLKPGRYSMGLTATDAAANTGRTVTVTFKILKR